jgi:hypothetical protein
MVASGALFTLCVLVLASNYIDRNHTNNVKESISTLYEDRLIVEDYILKMTIDIYKIKEALNMADLNDNHSPDKIAALLLHIDGLRVAYLKTKFTETEDVTFSALEKTLKEFETSASDSIQLKQELANKALVHLSELSAIQLAESKSIMNQAENLYISGKSASQFAFMVTIVILLVLQALVFTTRTLTGTQPPDPRLN